MTHSSDDIAAGARAMELLPCPFCGSEAEMFTDMGTSMRCGNDQCISRPDPFNDYCHKPSAIAAWNARAGLAAMPDHTDELLEAAQKAATYIGGLRPDNEGVEVFKALNAAIAKARARKVGGS